MLMLPIGDPHLSVIAATDLTDVSPSPDGNNKEPPAPRIDAPDSIDTPHQVSDDNPAITSNSSPAFD